MEKTRIERAIEYITKLFQGNGDGHDLSHSLRVYKNFFEEMYDYIDKIPNTTVLLFVMKGSLAFLNKFKKFNFIKPYKFNIMS